MGVKALHLVGPVGEWQDLTLRAREVMRRAGLIVVQDVYAVRPGLDGMGCCSPLLASGQDDALARILAALAESEVAWLVMRIGELAGPTERLVCALLDQGVELVSVPGASALADGLVVSGLPADRFTALGPLPVSKMDRSALWSRFAHESMTLVCEVWAGDLCEVLGEVRAHLGDRRIALCQGQTVWRGLASKAATDEWEGRVTLTIAGAGLEPDWTQERVLDELCTLLGAGTSPRDAAREVARRSGWPRRQVYEWALLVSRDEL